jgi:hypothetical protein
MSTPASDNPSLQDRSADAVLIELIAHRVNEQLAAHDKKRENEEREAQQLKQTWFRRVVEAAKTSWPLVVAGIVLTIAVNVIGFQSLIKKWAKEVVEDEIESPAHKASMRKEVLGGDRRIDVAVLESLENNKKFWDEVDDAAKKQAQETVQIEVNKQAIERIAALAGRLVENDHFRRDVIDKLISDRRWRHELVTAISQNPEALENFRGPAGKQGEPGTPGKPGDPGPPGPPGKAAVVATPPHPTSTVELIATKPTASPTSSSSAELPK